MNISQQELDLLQANSFDPNMIEAQIRACERVIKESTEAIESAHLRRVRLQGRLEGLLHQPSQSDLADSLPFDPPSVGEQDAAEQA